MPTTRSDMEIELSKLSSPRIFLVRMLVFLVLCGLVGVVLYKQIVTAFFANPGLNALIGAVRGGELDDLFAHAAKTGAIGKPRKAA